MTWAASHIFRDILMSFALMFVTLLWAPKRYVGGLSRIWRWAITLLVVVVAAQVRFVQAIVGLGIAALSDLFAAKARPRSIGRGVYVVLFVVVMASVLVLFSSQLFALWDRLVDAQSRYTVYREEMADGLSNLVFSAPLPFGFVLRILYGLIVPLPILTTDPYRLWLSIGTLIQFIFLPFLGAGIVQAIRNRSFWPILFAFVVLFGGAILITFTPRHITQFLPFGALLAAYGYSFLGRYRFTIWTLMAFSGLVLAAIYVFLRYV